MERDGKAKVYLTPIADETARDLAAQFRLDCASGAVNQALAFLIETVDCPAARVYVRYSDVAAAHALCVRVDARHSIGDTGTCGANLSLAACSAVEADPRLRLRRAQLLQFCKNWIGMGDTLYAAICLDSTRNLPEAASVFSPAFVARLVSACERPSGWEALILALETTDAPHRRYLRKRISGKAIHDAFAGCVDQALTPSLQGGMSRQIARFGQAARLMELSIDASWACLSGEVVNRAKEGAKKLRDFIVEQEAQFGVEGVTYFIALDAIYDRMRFSAPRRPITAAFIEQSSSMAIEGLRTAGGLREQKLLRCLEILNRHRRAIAAGKKAGL